VGGREGRKKGRTRTGRSYRLRKGKKGPKTGVGYEKSNGGRGHEFEKRGPLRWEIGGRGEIFYGGYIEMG